MGDVIDNVIRNRIKDDTRKAYALYVRKFYKWAQAQSEFPDLCSVKEDGEVELDLHAVSQNPNIFFSYLLSLKAKGLSGLVAPVATLRGNRSALLCHLKDKGHDVSAEFKTKVSDFFKGRKRMEAREKQSGLRDALPEGMDPLRFSVYHALAKQFMSQESDPFPHVYLVLSWNLMCRSVSTASICFAHMHQVDDSVGILFPMHKGDQGGDRGNDYRHVYANPLSPQICAFVALGLYLLSYPGLGTENEKLFPGGSQETRFYGTLKRLLSKESIVKDLQTMGYVNESLGTHSIRKGAGTFCTSGSTSGPGIVQVSLRMGWLLGGVSDRYLRFERAGDQHVGRVVAGLPQDSPDFALLPPHLLRADAWTDSVLHEAFPTLTKIERLKPVLYLCLASVCHHYEFLNQHLHAKHQARNSCIFTRPDIAAGVRERLITGLRSPVLTATGIPSTVVNMVYLQEFREEWRQAQGSTVRELERIIEERAVNPTTITRDYLRSTLEEFRQSILELTSAAQNSSSSPLVPSQETDFQWFQWGDRFRTVPENFELPHTDVRTAWRLWWEGNPALRVRPYCKIGREDLSARVRKHYSDWHVLLRSIEDKAEEHCPELLDGLRRGDTTLTHTVFDTACADGRVPVERVTGKGRKRRTCQLHVKQVLNLMRDSKRRRTTAGEGHERATETQ
jgi:hypothetical protein